MFFILLKSGLFFKNLDQILETESMDFSEPLYENNEAWILICENRDCYHTVNVKLVSLEFEKRGNKNYAQYNPIHQLYA